MDILVKISVIVWSPELKKVTLFYFGLNFIFTKCYSNDLDFNRMKKTLQHWFNRISLKTVVHVNMLKQILFEECYSKPFKMYSRLLFTILLAGDILARFMSQLTRQKYWKEERVLLTQQADVLNSISFERYTHLVHLNNLGTKSNKWAFDRIYL